MLHPSKEPAVPASLLNCPSCGAGLDPDASCSECGLDVNRDGIMDFVQGAVHTALDDLDYDAHYSVSLERTDREFEALKGLMGDRLPARIGSTLEIGCGTGGFTTGFLKGVQVSTAVLSDVSPTMLRTCRRRMQEAGLSPGRSVFVTYSGREACFASGAYDLCYGSFVVHHILDVAAFFREVHRLLKPGGACFFIEPNSHHHLALVHTAADVAARLIERRRDPAAISHLLNWIAEVRFNLVHAGDADRLAAREDKHMFDRAQIDELAGAAGFGHVEMLPYGAGDYGMSSLPVYLAQTGMPSALLEEISAIAASIAPRYFDLVDPAEQPPASVIYLRKIEPTGPRRPRPLRIPPRAAMDPPLRAHLVCRWSGGRLAVKGWACAAAPIFRLTLRTGQAQHVASVWLPRPDVYEAHGAAGYPPAQAICSGVQEEFGEPVAPSSLSIVAEMASGATIELYEGPMVRDCVEIVR
jgi:ubiquinone/menaquinone biosynthesis C-methylase UbiE